jgi:hypothetical protein
MIIYEREIDKGNTVMYDRELNTQLFNKTETIKY